MPVVLVRRGVLVTPAEAGWIIKRHTADPTSGSLRAEVYTLNGCFIFNQNMGYPGWYQPALASS